MSHPLACACLLCCVVGGLAPSEAGAQGLPNGDARAAGFDPVKLRRIDAMLADAVAREKIVGGSALIARRGKVVSFTRAGVADISGKPFDEDTIVRICSMTKPMTSVAILMLVEEGKLRLDDPVARHLPEFRATRVLDPASSGTETVPLDRDLTIHHLLTHTAGLVYRMANHPRLGPLYVEAAISDGLVETPGTIGDNVRRLARLPLARQPGTAWDYSLAIDVLGRVVEVASGRTLAEFFAERITGPLRMADTHFLLPAAKRDRLADLFTRDPQGKWRPFGDRPLQTGPQVISATYPTWDTGHYYSGGAGLVSTQRDYARFLQLMLNRGELDGVRLLKPSTVAQMTTNQIGDLAIPNWQHGDKFGYGFAVFEHPERNGEPVRPGSYSWGGYYYTYFWVDPKAEMFGILMTQTYPSDDLDLRERLKALTYEALAE